MTAPAPTTPQPFAERVWWRWLVTLLVAAAVLVVGPPDGIAPDGWRLLAIFLATIVGSILRPAPAGAIVFLGVVAIAATGTMTPAAALKGYADPVVWLVLCAFFISRGVMKTGLGRRIAFLFIRALGHKSLGLSYALGATDVVLASIIPSNSARAGGIVFPIVRSLAEAYDSTPGATRRRLGAYLMVTVYQVDVIACAMFLTGQASNVLIAKFAFDVTQMELTYSRWLIGGLVPGLVALLLVPYVLFRVFPPDVKETPHAAELGQRELDQMGPMSRGEWLMLAVFAGVALLWMTPSLHGIHYAVVAMLGVAALLLAKVIGWDDLITERQAWDVFIWYGGLVRMAEALGETGITKAFAEEAASWTAGWGWAPALAILVVVYFYAHYAFASITAHATAMFTPFLVVSLAAGAPPQLAVLSLAAASNLDASLTHYGTTTAPIYFGARYVTQREWWRFGLIASVLTLGTWAIVGVGWWKVLGWW
ncbi:MAG: DASS family sodium-coupled anion symporter [Gemmatimonadaceae bacterium]|nr:DASS family sodium-coupled anion symporter [Gemmatimonadaceae bacterium]